MIIDHTFLFPRLIWTIASIVLVKFGYPLGVMLLSYFAIYLLYVFVSWINFLSVRVILAPHPKEVQFYTHLWWVAFTLPAYNLICSVIRLIGVINGMTTKASWQLRRFDEETSAVKQVLKQDVKALREKKEEHHE
jgi:hypothetical protein